MKRLLITLLVMFTVFAVSGCPKPQPPKVDDEIPDAKTDAGAAFAPLDASSADAGSTEKPSKGKPDDSPGKGPKKAENAPDAS